MRRLALFTFLLMVVLSCKEKAAWETKPLTEPGERTYQLEGVIVSRDEGSNTVMVRHEKIDGLMEAMTMDFSVRGAAVATLPPDNIRIAATLHVLPGAYWLTSIRKAP